MERPKRRGDEKCSAAWFTVQQSTLLISDASGTKTAQDVCCLIDSTRYRNGASASDTTLCAGPSESWGTPCYPPPCNADWKKLNCARRALQGLELPRFNRTRLHPTCNNDNIAVQDARGTRTLHRSRRIPLELRACGASASCLTFS